MNLVPQVKLRTVLRWIPTIGAGLVPLAGPVFYAVSWGLALTVSATGVVLGAVTTLVRVLMPEVLSHIRLMRQASDEHTRAVLRERNQHDEVVLLLHKVSGRVATDVDVAAVASGIRCGPPVESPVAVSGRASDSRAELVARKPGRRRIR